MPKITPAVRAYLAELGSKGRAVMSDAQREASRRNGCNNRGGIPDAAQIAAFAEMVDHGRRPRVGPRLGAVLRQHYAGDPDMLAIVNECRRGRQTTWTLLDKARAKAGVSKSA